MVRCHDVRGAVVGIPPLDGGDKRRDAAVEEGNVVEVLPRVRPAMRMAVRVEAEHVHEQQRRPFCQRFWCLCK